MTILAIDPGTDHSAFVLWSGQRLLSAGILPNEQLLQTLPSWYPLTDHIVCEQIESYGMAVGREVFQTVFFTGRLWDRCQQAGKPVALIPRRLVKLYLCGSSRAKDANIIQALKDRFGDKPTKTRPNPVYGTYKLKKDEWQALALGVTVWEQHQENTRRLN